MSYIDKGIQVAEQAALESDCPTYRVGAALLRKNRVVSFGRNYYKKSHTKSRTRWNGIHAEFNCLHGLNPENIRNCTIFVVRIAPQGNRAMARPCDDCRDLLKRYGIRVFYYTNSHGEVVREVLNE